MSEFICWKCNAALVNVILPMSRREECTACSADQHVCKMCIFYDGNKGCNEDQAEDVSDMERANFCDYFKPQILSKNLVVKSKSEQAKADFAALFGDEIPEQNQEDKLLSPAELAEKKMRDMLNGF
jgi:hypothetical protein